MAGSFAIEKSFLQICYSNKKFKIHSTLSNPFWQNIVIETLFLKPLLAFGSEENFRLKAFACAKTYFRAVLNRTEIAGKCFPTDFLCVDFAEKRAIWILLSRLSFGLSVDLITAPISGFARADTQLTLIKNKENQSKSIKSPPQEWAIKRCRHQSMDLPSYACESISHTQIFRATRRPTSPHNFSHRAETSGKSRNQQHERRGRIHKNLLST